MAGRYDTWQEPRYSGMYPVWWWTGNPKKNGYNMARVLGWQPYRGRYPQWFKYVLLLECPHTKSGHLGMAVEDYQVNEPT